MKRFTHIVGTALLVMAALSLDSQTANAGRIGGAVSGYVTVPPFQSVYFNMPFVAGEPAVVSAVGNGRSPLALFIYDGGGNFWTGSGLGDRKTAATLVQMDGFFLIEVRNLGPVANTFILSTN